MTNLSTLRAAILCALAGFLCLVCVYQADAQTLLDPSTLHVGAGVGTACQTGCAGDPNKIGPGGTLDIFQESSAPAAVDAPILLILSVPNDTVNNTGTYFGPTAAGVYTSIGVQFYNPYTSGSPVSGTANVAGTGLFTNASKNNLGLQANPGPLTGAFYGSLGPGQEVYSFLNFTGGGGIDNSNSFTNFTLAGNDPTATSFGIYVIALSGSTLAGNGLINVTGLNVPTGTFVDAFGEGSKNSQAFVVPFTEAGFTGPSPTPEPSSILLFGTGLLLAGGILRRRLLPVYSSDLY